MWNLEITDKHSRTDIRKLVAIPNICSFGPYAKEKAYFYTDYL